MASVRCQEIVKNFGDVRVLKGIDLDIADAEFIVFVGPSGCGKTTLLRIIAGLEEVTSGDLYIGAKRVNDTPPKQRNIAMVFQNYAIYPHMSVAENISFGMKIRGSAKPEMDKAVKEVAGVLGLSELLDRKPKQLSGGQRQRVAMGRAIVRDPAVFLMDEPLSNLDAELRNQMRVEIKSLQHRLKTTTIYVTHDQVEAMTLADRIAVMKDGEIQQFGTPDDLYAMPSNKFVAGFIGTPKMNFFAAEKTEGGNLALPNGATIDLLDGHRKAIAKVDKVEVGFRPDSINIVPTPGTKSARSPVRWSAGVQLCESLGGETIVHFAENGCNFQGRVGRGVKIAEGDRVEVSFPAESAFLFCGDSGRCIGYPTVG